MSSTGKTDTTYKIDALVSPVENTPMLQSPSDNAPEKRFSYNTQKASSKEVVHDAPEVVAGWVPDRKTQSPLYDDDTVVSGYPSPRSFPSPLFEERNASIVSQRHYNAPPERSRICGLRKRSFIALGILIWAILLGVGLGVGLGLGLKKSNKSRSGEVYVEPYCVDHPEHCIGGTLGSNYYTTNGTFNGTGIAIAGESWNHQQRKIMTVYFQHWTGDIRWMQLTPRGEWIGGSKSEVIVSDAKNATPISIVAYAVNNTAQWHLFYIDKNNLVRQKSNTNLTNIWENGPLNELNLTAYNSQSVGLQACWYGNYYGDSDASNFPTHDGSNNTIEFDSDTHGMHLWYPTEESVFKQYGWYEGQEQWLEQHTWPDMNGHAGVGCYSWGPGSTTYAMLVNKENTAEVWWKDTDANTESTSSHPINTWVNATQFSIPNVHPSTSLGYTEYFYAQMADGSIRGHNIDWDAENTTGIEENHFTVGGARGPVLGIKGTHMSVTAVADQSGGTSLYVFYQTRGDDLSVFTRDVMGGQWTQGELPVPDE